MAEASLLYRPVTAALSSSSSSRTAGSVPACCSSGHWNQSYVVPRRSQSVFLRSNVWGVSLDAGSFIRHEGEARLLRRRASPVAYLEGPKQPVVDFFNKVLGSLPIVGLVSRILSDEGGVGTDRLRFVEFCTRVEKNFTYEGSRAFYTFADRHGKVCMQSLETGWKVGVLTNLAC